MDDAGLSRLHMRVEFEDAVDEGRMTAVADAEDVTGGLCGVYRVEGGEFGGIRSRSCEDALGFAAVASNSDSVGADCGEFPAGEPGAAGVGFCAGGSVGGGVSGFHVVVIEVGEDVEVVVGGDVGEDVEFARVSGGGGIPGVDRVESEEGVGGVDADEAFVGFAAVDDEPDIALVRVEFHGVEHVAGPENLEAIFGVVGAEDADDHVALC